VPDISARFLSQAERIQIADLRRSGMSLLQVAARKAALQAAGGTYRGDTEQALSLLRLLYRDEYTFGYGAERGVFWVIKDGKIRSLLTAPTPEALGGLIDINPELAS
jgi:hypothetical protein